MNSSPPDSFLTAAKHDWPAATAATLLLLFVLFGGGGSEAPLRAGILEGFAAVLFAGLVAGHFSGRPLPGEAVGPLAFFAFALAIIAAQLTPLPPSAWMNLPGREAAVSAAQAAGQENLWRPLSLDPEATRRSACALIVPLAMALATIASSNRGKIWLVRSLVAGALVSAVLGMFQIALGNPESLAPYGGRTSY